MRNIKVSVLCMTYNQENYIEKALTSFLEQRVDFDIEIIIHDDASTDKTVAILKRYQKKFPKIIKLILKNENQFEKGIRAIMIRDLIPYAQGQYIAMCEGDDYFLDNKKLQIQADYLDRHPDISLCFHKAKVVFQRGEFEDYIYPKYVSVDVTMDDLLKKNIIPMNSVMYRKVDYSHISLKQMMPVDLYLHFYHMQYGKVGYIDRVMSCYRRHEGGIWWLSIKNPIKLFCININFIGTFYILVMQLSTSKIKSTMMMIMGFLNSLKNERST